MSMSVSTLVEVVGVMDDDGNRLISGVGIIFCYILRINHDVI